MPSKRLFALTAALVMTASTLIVGTAWATDEVSEAAKCPQPADETQPAGDASTDGNAYGHNKCPPPPPPPPAPCDTNNTSPDCCFDVCCYYTPCCYDYPCCYDPCCYYAVDDTGNATTAFYYPCYCLDTAAAEGGEPVEGSSGDPVDAGPSPEPMTVTNETEPEPQPPADDPYYCCGCYCPAPVATDGSGASNSAMIICPMETEGTTPETTDPPAG